MMNWKVKVEEDFGRSRLILTGNSKPIGVITIPTGEFIGIWRKLMSSIVVIAKDSIKETLTNRLWHDAQLLFDNSPELAKQKLIEFGWSNEKIEQYSDELARELTKKLAEHLPWSTDA